MKKIKLQNNKYDNLFALVDDEDFEFLNQWKWGAYPDARTFYAKRTAYSKVDGILVKKTVSMHRVLLGLNNPKEQVDHIDHDGLNNQKSNIRKSSGINNSRNKRSKINGTSIYKGVVLMKGVKGKKWRAIISGKINSGHIGCFYTEEEAAMAYDEVARKHYGEFANLNFK